MKIIYENPFLEFSREHTAIAVVFEIIFLPRMRWYHRWTKSVNKRAQDNFVNDIVTNNPFIVLIDQFDITMELYVTWTLEKLFIVIPFVKSVKVRDRAFRSVS